MQQDSKKHSFVSVSRAFVRQFVTPATALATGLLSSACATDANPRANVSDDLETPRYVELERDGAFELRRVEPYIAATTMVEGESLDEASRKGFRVLADYIFGNNVSKTEVSMTAPVAATPPSEGTSEKVAMTAPVAAEKVTPKASEATSEKVAMTAPVAAEKTSTTSSASGTSLWKIAFMMPSEYTLQSLPTPNDDRVKFEEKPGRCQAAVVFDGFTPPEKVEEKTAELTAWLKTKGMEPTSTPVVARYNDPLTLPWNRRNEVVVDIPNVSCDDEAKPGA